MIDEPEASCTKDEPEKEQTNGLSVTPVSVGRPEPERQTQTEKPRRQEIMRLLVASWRGVRRGLTFLDEHGGTVGAFAAVVIAVLTGFYVYYSHAQWKVMSGQLTEMRSANRAWIGLSGLNTREDHPAQDIPLGQIIPGAPIAANAVLENLGKTPAQIDRLGFQFEVRSNPVPEDYKYANNKPGPAMFASQTMQTTNSDVTISSSDFIDLRT